MLLNYKFEIYPTNEQSKTLHSWVNICRQTYNSALLDKNRYYQKHKKKLKKSDLQTTLKNNKKNYPFLKEVPSQPLQEVLVRLEKSFDKFSNKEARYPKLKSIKDYSSITFTQFGVARQYNKCKKTGEKKPYVARRAASLGKGGKLQISGLGLIDVNWHRKLDGKVKQVIIKRQSDRWFAVFCVQKTKANSTIDRNNSIGIDVGIKKFAVLSNGQEIENPKYLRKKEKQLKRAQQRLSKREKGSKNWWKQVKKVQQLHMKVANQRRDFLHKQSFRLAQTYSLVFVEDLKIKNMVKNRKLAKSIHDAGWGMFRNFLDYKCEKNGGRLIRVAPHYTSQDCSGCGERVKKSLSVRTHICTKCGTTLDRDHNAAINIKQKGLEQLT